MDTSSLPIICVRRLIAVFDDGEHRQLSFTLLGPRIETKFDRQRWTYVVTLDTLSPPLEEVVINDNDKHPVTQDTEEVEAGDSLQSVIFAVKYLDHVCKLETSRKDAKFYRTGEYDEEPVLREEYEHFGDY